MNASVAPDKELTKVRYAYLAGWLVLMSLLAATDGVCLESPVRKQNFIRKDRNPNLTIVAVNSSEELERIDVEIRVDQELVFSGELNNPRQAGASKEKVLIAPHVTIELRLPEGQHRLRVTSARGNTRVEERFDLTSKRWLWLGYEDWDAAGNRVPPHHFAYWIRETPILFQ